MSKAIQMNAKRVAPNFPAWDLFADGVNIGVLTDFEGEGPVATVRTETMGEKTVSEDDIATTLHLARGFYVNGLAANEDPYAGWTDEDFRAEAAAEAFAEAGFGAMAAGASQEVAYQAAYDAMAAA